MRTKEFELKHLAPYLPYGVIFLRDEHNWKDGEYTETWRAETQLNCNTLRDLLNGSYYENPKIVLRPLSDLTKEITHNGERFVASDRTQVGMQHGRIYSNIGVVENRIITNTISYSDMTYLISLHFDVFGLIQKGLAISVNELDKNPYQ